MSDAEGKNASTTFTEEDRNRFREARILIRNEFGGLDEHQQYTNAFSRLLKWDPLRRVPMLGTDQRDQFVPIIRSGIAANLTQAASVLDIGSGDGQTFALISGAILAGSTIDAIEPNAEYLKSFDARLTQQARLRKGNLRCAPFTPDLLKNGDAAGPRHDLILVIHALYFFDNLETSLLSIYEALAPGGAVFIVFADEQTAYTGLSYRAYMRATGKTDLAEDHAELCRNRRTLFAQDQAKAGTLTDLINRSFGDAGAHIAVQRQETRLYGHSHSDIIALCNIAGLEVVLSTDKFEAAADLIEHSPAVADFRIEADPTSVRYGMFSVLQPQIVATVRKIAR
jgi:SAM-dependent methyltransferase